MGMSNSDRYAIACAIIGGLCMVGSAAAALIKLVWE
jgi:hypothetical protein